jgi:hypothetical protein
MKIFHSDIKSLFPSLYVYGMPLSPFIPAGDRTRLLTIIRIVDAAASFGNFTVRRGKMERARGKHDGGESV